MAEISKEQSKKQNLLCFVATEALLLFITMVLEISVIWKWILWSFISTGFIYILLWWYPRKRFSWKSKMIILPLFYIVFWIICNDYALTSWMKEKANQPSGELSINWNEKKKPISDKAKLEIGTSRIVLIYNNSVLPLMFEKIDSNIKWKNVKGKMFLTTDVHDKTGALIVNITDNHWTVSDSKAILWEKNFTNSALEIKDKRGYIVLQVELLPDRIRIQGEWWDEYGNGVRYAQQHYDIPGRGGASTTKLSKDNYPKEPRIKPMFKYPSEKYFGAKINTDYGILERIFLYRIWKNN